MEIVNLKTIIGRFSDFSKMPKPQLEHIDARDAIERVRALYEVAGALGREAAAGEQDKVIHFKVEFPSKPLLINADPELLHRALSNLVLNAMDAMPGGGTLSLSAKSHQDKAEIRVADTGTGMTPEECERLFTPYYTTKEHGTGLGLAIVQSVVADQAGTISVESPADGGAVFVITLPKADEAIS
jgi:two-component system, NtrC family, nitrogen regulation sensor histidine kinase NtrY